MFSHEQRETLSLIADIVGILGATIITIGSAFYAIFKKNKDNISIFISLWAAYLLKASLIFFIGSNIYVFVYDFVDVLIFKPHVPFMMSLSILIFIPILALVVMWLIGTIIWTASFRYVVSFFNFTGFGLSATEPKLEILNAVYGAKGIVVDLTYRLSTLVKNNKLEVRGSNDLAGDPLHGEAKQLTVTYRYGLFPKTITINENELLVLPPKE